MFGLIHASDLVNKRQWPPFDTKERKHWAVISPS
jgi:hypothetical protein